MYRWSTLPLTMKPGIVHLKLCNIIEITLEMVARWFYSCDGPSWHPMPLWHEAHLSEPPSTVHRPIPHTLPPDQARHGYLLGPWAIEAIPRAPPPPTNSSSFTTSAGPVTFFPS